MADRICFIFLPLASLSLLLATAYHGPDLPPGPYCGLTGECCSERRDSCSHEILDTLCYCDQHCNRTHDDCCPDYEEVCLGIRPSPPPAPIREPIRPKVCRLGDTKMEGCNKCTCELDQYRRESWSCEQDECIISPAVLELRSTWRPANYSQLYARKLKDGLVYKLGTLPLSDETHRMGAIRYDKDIAYPPSFDARARWSGHISPVVDQGWCGSDWAVVIASVASDRFAIQSNGAEDMLLSPQALLSCNAYGQEGCQGGHIDIAWNFVRTHGLVDEDCFPYEASVTPCPFKRRGDLRTDGCIPAVSKRTERYKVGPLSRLNRENDIMYDIMESGPVQAIMTVYQDFFHYRDGVYRHTPYGDQKLQGLHSVKIVGWGQDRGDKFWIVANSWGTSWGENGYFRIARGSNESGIESFVVSVLSEVTEA